MLFRSLACTAFITAAVVSGESKAIRPNQADIAAAARDLALEFCAARPVDCIGVLAKVPAKPDMMRSGGVARRPMRPADAEDRQRAADVAAPRRVAAR